MNGAAALADALRTCRRAFARKHAVQVATLQRWRGDKTQRRISGAFAAAAPLPRSAHCVTSILPFEYVRGIHR